ncbi:MAG: TfoX/Sxy family protein [Candidatus Hydrogenedentes bacterium]|nr:TfoX/Sxy family protein [Candidatus Hydrogenedentota bacterium]
MAVKKSGDTSFVQFVVDQLAGIEGIRYRPMFGGFGLYCGSNFFGIVAEDRVYFKTNDATRQEYEAAGMKPFRPTTKQTLKNYMEVPPDALEDAGELLRLAESAVVIARTCDIC